MMDLPFIFYTQYSIFNHLLNAAARGPIDIFKFVIEQNIFSDFSHFGQTILEECCISRSIEVFRYSLTLPHPESFKLPKLISAAVYSGSLPILQLLHQKFDRFEDFIIDAVKQALTYRKPTIINFLLNLNFFS
jgi:hypothetical protein